MNNHIDTLFIITGPTGTGKTELGIRVAKEINGEIISADSRQVYKYLNIGTGKPQGKWMKINGETEFICDNIRYHLVDILEPDETFSAGKFVNLALEKIESIRRKGKNVIIVGGTGLYIKSVIDGLTYLPPADNKIRETLYKIKNKYGSAYLYEKLKEVDRKKAEEIHPNNTVRIIRALEIFLLTGKKISSLYQEMPLKKVKFNKLLFIGLNWQKEILYEKIKNRVGLMLATGMIEETEELLKKGYIENIPAFHSLGYKYVIEYLKNKISYNDMKEMIITDTKHYIKRQLTWFKKDKRIVWFDYSDEKAREETFKNIIKAWKG